MKQLAKWQPLRNARVVHRNYEPAMTFDEIADALGTTRQSVFVLYASGMEKLRRILRANPELYEEMLALSSAKSSGFAPTYPEPLDFGECLTPEAK